MSTVKVPLLESELKLRFPGPPASVAASLMFQAVGSVCVFNSDTKPTSAYNSTYFLPFCCLDFRLLDILVSLCCFWPDS